MGSRSGGEFRVRIPKKCQKIVREIKKLTGGKHTNGEVYTMLRACNMNRDKALEKLLEQVSQMELELKPIKPGVVHTSSMNEVSNSESNSSVMVTKFLPTTCTKTTEHVQLKNKPEKFQSSLNKIVILPKHIQDLQQELPGISFGNLDSSVMLKIPRRLHNSEYSTLLLPSQRHKGNNEGTSLSILHNSTTDQEKLSLHPEAAGDTDEIAVSMDTKMSGISVVHECGQHEQLSLQIGAPGDIDETTLLMDTKMSRSISMAHECGYCEQESNSTHGAPEISTLEIIPASKSSLITDLHEPSDTPGFISRTFGSQSTSTASTHVESRDADVISGSSALIKLTAPLIHEVASFHVSGYPPTCSCNTCQFLQSGSHQVLFNSAVSQRHPPVLNLPPLAYNALHEGYGLYIPQPIGRICFLNCPPFIPFTVDSYKHGGIHSGIKGSNSIDSGD